jgi:hypothetical protein
VTDANARTVANTLLWSAGAAAAYVVLTRPRLRRAALQALKLWLGATVPAYLLNEARVAWVESGQVR